MRKIRIAAIALCIATAFSLSACSRAVRGARDEIAMYSWRAELESGKTVTLSFTDTDAELSARGEDFEMTVGGDCFIDDESFVICDTATGMNYSFGYILHGDSVELTYDGGAIVLDKYWEMRE